MKQNGVILCIFLVFFTYACDLTKEIEETEKIWIENQTGEVVVIYYYSYRNTEIYLTTIHIDETGYRHVEPEKKYYARGRNSKIEYGERVFSKVPSKFDTEQTWIIK